MIAKSLTETGYKKIDEIGYKCVDSMLTIKNRNVEVTYLYQKGTKTILAIRYSFPSSNPLDYYGTSIIGKIFDSVIDSVERVDKADYKLD